MKKSVLSVWEDQGLSMLLGGTQRNRILATVLPAALLLVLLLPASAFAYATWSPTAPSPFEFADCTTCHGADPVSGGTGEGPHGGYLSTTNKCKLCHDVHGAPATSVLLLRGPTVAQTCQMCHDGTASKHVGPYESVTAGGGSVVSEHSYELTGVVPGGSNDLAHNLYCSDCHSVHGANTVAQYISDATKPLNLELDWTDNLLKANINGNAAPEYGAMWCATCHDLRHSTNTGAVRNHPVANDPNWGYGDVVTTVTLASLRVENNGVNSAIGMGQTNAAYIMEPVPESGDGHVPTRTDPMCQQCHEDARNVEQIYQADVYSPNIAPYTNPAFLTFPHQSTTPYFLVEQYDDLCTNCHSVGG